MPSESQHLSQYRRNEALALRLEADGETDWAITLLFYAALHLVDAYLARTNVHPRNHIARRQTIANHPILSAVWPRYDEIEQRSQNARYDCVSFSAANLGLLRTQFFNPLEQQLRAWLSI